LEVNAMGTEYIKIKCLEVNQPIGKFYVGVMNYDDLERISLVDVRHMASKESELETYMGIQRTLDGSRVGKIKKYLEGVDATFPTSIIVSLSSKDTTYDSNSNTMQIADKPDVAKILDGQHRLKGLEGFGKSGNKFQLNLTIFLDVELEEQALIFATINQSQTKVNNSLVYDLFEFAKVRSPQKTAHNICKALNEKNDSPFKDKIKILGTADDKDKETISQATFVENLISYISADKVKDRNIYKAGGTPKKANNEELKKLFFRNLFIEEKDGEIARIIWNYFKAVEKKWPIAWESPQANLILNRSNGFAALMFFLKDAYLNIVKTNIGTVPSMPEFLAIFDKVGLKDTDFTKDNFVPGSSGRSALYRKFKDDTKI